MQTFRLPSAASQPISVEEAQRRVLDEIRTLAHQSKDNRAAGAMADARMRQRTMQADLDGGNARMCRSRTWRR